MAVCRPLFTDEENAALQATVSTTDIFGYVCDTGWQNVIRSKQNTANVHSENLKWTWLQIFPSPSPSPSLGNFYLILFYYLFLCFSLYFCDVCYCILFTQVSLLYLEYEFHNK